MPFTVPIRLQVSDTQVLEWCTLCLALASGFWALFVGQVMYKCVVFVLQDALQG